MAKKAVTRDVICQTRCSAEQKLKWDAAAAQAQRTLADWMRITLDAAAAKGAAKGKGKR